MGFRLALSPTFWARVQAEITSPEGKDDRRATVTFQCQYKRLSQDEFYAMRDRALADGKDDRDLAREVVVNWKDVDDEDGAPLTFTADNFDALLNLGFGTAIMAAFYDNLPKAKRKN